MHDNLKSLLSLCWSPFLGFDSELTRLTYQPQSPISGVMTNQFKNWIIRTFIFAESLLEIIGSVFGFHWNAGRRRCFD